MDGLKVAIAWGAACLLYAAGFNWLLGLLAATVRP
jgi:hypothetical protein